MIKDREGIKLLVGDKVELIPGMGIDGNEEGFIWDIDGEDIYVDIDGEIAHRYGNEMWKVT